MIDIVFGGSPFKAINNAYPNKYKEWEFNYVPISFWNLNTAKEAIIWLIEVKLKWTDKQVKNNFCVDTLKQNGLYGMLNDIFNGSTYNVIKHAYPDKYKNMVKTIRF